jgi:hypothetical protein
MSHYGKLRHITIDSKNRISGTPTDFDILIDIEKNTTYNRVCLLDCDIPKSFYTVQTNSYFTLTESAGSVNITLDAGNYNILSFKNIVAAALNSNSPTGYTYTMTFPNSNSQPSTGKFTINVSGNGVDIPYITINTTLYDQFGCDQEDVLYLTANTYTSANVVDFQKTNTVFVKSNCCDGEKDGILAEIYTKTSDYSTIEYNSPDIIFSSRVLSRNSVNLYHFTIVDKNELTLQLNGGSVVMTILFYEISDFHELAKKTMIMDLLSGSNSKGQG